MPNEYAETSSGMLLIADGQDAPLRWDGLWPTADARSLRGISGSL